MKKRIAVLISNAGSGTNLQAIIDAIVKQSIDAQIAVVVSDAADAYGLQRAHNHGIPTYVVHPKEDLVTVLTEQYPVDLIVLAGWKKIITDQLIETFADRILNLHPGVIPEQIDGVAYNPDGSEGLWNRGKFTDKAIQKVLDQQATYAGSSIHLLTKQFDFGPVLGRCFEAVQPGDTVETLYRRLKNKENALYVEVLTQLCAITGKTILVIGAGGREHAIGWKLKQSPLVNKIFFAPGNAGTAEIGENVAIAVEDIAALAQFAKQQAVDLTMVGPELPLSLGIVDLFHKKGLQIVGPTKHAARLETSKAWATKFMARHDIPHPQSAIFEDVVSARLYLTSWDWKQTAMVIKVDGLAAGKGVFLPDSYDEAAEIVKRIMVDREFGSAGDMIVIQERVVGQEVSLMAVTDGTTIIPTIPVQDYKRLHNGNTGPMTGGVGSIAPYPALSQQLIDDITRTILLPTISGMSTEGNPFVGVLYAGLMLTDAGPQVLEFNVRFGDPETQALMPLLETDLYPILEACTTNTLTSGLVTFSDQAAVCVILTADGYPGEYAKGTEITIPSNTETIFHAGTAFDQDRVVTSGGRVLAIVAQASTISAARTRVYQQIGENGVHFEGMQYRTDIGMIDVETTSPVTRIEVFTTIPDMRAAVKQKQLQELASITDLWLADVYTVDASLTAAETDQIAAMVVNPVFQSTILPDKKFSWAIEIGFLPGVTDNIGSTMSEMVGKPVYSSQVLFLSGDISLTEANAIAASLYNPLIQRAHLKSYQQYGSDGGMDPVVPHVQLTKQPSVTFVNLHVPDDELIKIGKQGILNADGSRRGPLALDLQYLTAIRAYFDTQKRNPTDLELESLAQTWSEHCKHTIFADPIDDITEGLYKRYIKRATEEIRAKRGANDICVSVFSDNSGAIIFDDQYLITDKVETHNSPSALDPFGGAITGIVGVNRDALGFGMGAKPVINRYGFCFAPPDDHTTLYRDREQTQPLLSARRLLDGVVAGVNSGGNCSGIPTTQGFIYFDPRYRGKPLVFVGTVGLIPRQHHGQLLHEKKAQPGDYIVMVGGRVGIDGIHGATFSSEALTTGSPATAVQIGDPITQKKLSDVLVKEARDLGLYHSITDNGAGGLSCSVAEMAKESGGCSVSLDAVPLKYPGLEPWQIWISESQERMTLAVPKDRWEQLQQLLKRRGVEATVIGEFTASGKCEVSYQGITVMNVGMEFLHNGLPPRPMQTSWTAPVLTDSQKTVATDLTEQFTTMVAKWNLGSTEMISQQYDHDVQGGSVIKPLQGKGRINGDATVVRPVLSSQKAVVLSHGLYPLYSELDPYAMAAASIDTAIRNAIVAGAPLEHIAILDNWCWCNPTDSERLGQLKLAVQALYDTAVAYQTPIISGKDSMFNDFKGFDQAGTAVTISILPTLLISAIAVMPDSTQAVSLDAKFPEDVIYILGETHPELGGSEYLGAGARVPQVDVARNKQLYQAYHQAVTAGIISSAVSIHHGGLALAVAKMTMGGQLGCDLHLQSIPGTATDAEEVLFSESQGRIVVTVAPEQVEQFETIMQTVAYAQIGTIRSDQQLHIFDRDESLIVSTSVHETLVSYKSTFGIVHQIKPSALILTGYGINCEEETAHAFHLAGATTRIAHINDLIDGSVQIDHHQVLAFPGGFSFGDDTGSGNAFAQKTKQHVWNALLEFVTGDHLVIGICNGFQILVNLGLLPALEGKYGSRQVALIHNDSAMYTARWVDLMLEGTSPWFAGISKLSLPIAHGEGKFYAAPEILQQLQQKHLIAGRYINGEIANWQHLPANPNGSLENIAAISDETGRIVGLMPHPERAVAFTQLPNWNVLKEQFRRQQKPIPQHGPGLQIFTNAVNYFL